MPFCIYYFRLKTATVMPSGASKDSLKEYVKSIAAPGTNSANIFGLKTWLSSSRSETAAPLLENEDNFQDPGRAASDSTWLGVDSHGFLGLVSQTFHCCPDYHSQDSFKIHKHVQILQLNFQ